MQNAVRLYMLWAFLRNVLNERRLEMQRPRVKRRLYGLEMFSWQSGFGFWGALRRVTAYDESVALETRVEPVVAEPRRMATREILTLLSMVPAPPADGRARLDGPRPASHQ